MLVAKEDLHNFTSTKLNPDYEGRTFHIEKSSILAYENIEELRVTKNVEEFKDVSSIFTVKCLPEGEQTNASISLEADKIAILLPRNQYLIYTSSMQQSDMQCIANSLVILPALVYVLEATLYQDDESYENLNWYQSICAAFKRKNTTLQEELEGKGSFVVAQEMMESPLLKALMGMNIMKPQGETL